VQTVFFVIFLGHVVFGICALVLFWFPAFTKKGSPPHRKFGVWYSFVMHGVVVSGISMALLSISIPELVKPDAFSATKDPETVRNSIIGFAVLLLHLSILTLVSVRYGQLVLQAKKDRKVLKQPFQMAITLCLLLSGMAILLKGLSESHLLMLIFGPLGIFIATTNLHFTFKKHAGPKGWLVEHIGAYIGTGIAAYTAFIAFGGRQIFYNSGYLQLAMWVAPGAIGTIFILFLSRKYSK
jgi:hypothetical protein